MNHRRPWPPLRGEGPLSSFSELQLRYWLDTTKGVLDEKGRRRLLEAIAHQRGQADKVQQQQTNFVKRTVKKSKRRRNADPPKPTNTVLVKHFTLGGIPGISLGSVLAGLEIYEKVKGTGIVWDLFWLISQLGNIELGVVEWIIFGGVTGIGCFGAALWKLAKG